MLSLSARHQLLRCSTRRAQSTIPWFVDPADEIKPASQLDITQIHPVPDDAPAYLKELHTKLYQSPHLEKASVVVTRPASIPTGPDLPLRAPQGRRKRGGVYATEGVSGMTNGLWNWIVMAQVKEGTEGRGAIESAVRTARQSLAAQSRPLPPNSKKRMHNGWAMIDAGDFAVHIVSKEVRDKYFGQLVEQWRENPTRMS